MIDPPSPPLCGTALVFSYFRGFCCFRATLGGEVSGRRVVGQREGWYEYVTAVYLLLQTSTRVLIRVRGDTYVEIAVPSPSPRPVERSERAGDWRVLFAVPMVYYMPTPTDHRICGRSSSLSTQSSLVQLCRNDTAVLCCAGKGEET